MTKYSIFGMALYIFATVFICALSGKFIATGKVDGFWTVAAVAALFGGVLCERRFNKLKGVNDDRPTSNF